MTIIDHQTAGEDQAERAVRSALAAVEAVANLKIEDDQALEARVGIATGQVVIGDLVGEAVTEEDAVAGETPGPQPSQGPVS